MEERERVIIEKLKNMLCEYIELQNEVTPEMSLVNEIGVDSFSLVCLIGDIENEFKIEIPTKQLSKFQTLCDMINFIEANSKVV